VENELGMAWFLTNQGIVKVVRGRGKGYPKVAPFV
jgi:hypothetical protein